MEKENQPEPQIFADTFDGDTGGMEGQGTRARGKEGTYRNKFPVPASRTLSERKRDRK